MAITINKFVGGHLIFNSAENDFVDLGADTLSFANGSADFSIIAYLKDDGSANNTDYVSFGDNLLIRIRYSTSYGIMLSVFDGTYHTITSSLAATSDWCMVVCTLEVSTKRMTYWINGQYIGETFLNDLNYVFDQTNTFGKGIVSPFYSDCKIGKVAICNYILSTSQIQYLTPANIANTSPIHYWPINDGSGSVVEDVVGGVNGTNNGASWSEPDYEVEVSDRSVYKRKLMGENVISLQIISQDKLDFYVGDYIVWEGETFVLNRPPVADVTKMNLYSYTCEFESNSYELLNKILESPITGRTDFFFTGTAAEFIDLILSNMSVNFPGWTAGDTVETDRKNLYFENENCRGVLNTISSEFNIEFIIRDREISLYERYENELALTLTMGQDNALYQIKKSNVDDFATITRIYGFGGEKNISSDYRDGRDRLIFINPTTGKNTFEDFSVTSKIFERSVVFEDIYPRLRADVTEVSPDNLTITVPSIDFDINDYQLQGVAPKCVFLTGNLMGREFSFSYNHATHKITLDPETDNYGNVFPSADFPPEIDDVITLVDIEMPQSYIDSAEAELANAVETYFNNLSFERVKYDIKINPPFFALYDYSLSPGDVITLNDSKIDTDTQIRVISVKQNINDPYSVSAEISNITLQNEIDRLVASLSKVTNEAKKTIEYNIGVGGATQNWVISNFAQLADLSSNVAGVKVTDFSSNEYIFGVNEDGYFMAGNPGDLNRCAFMEPSPATSGGVAFWNNIEEYIDFSNDIIVNSYGIGFWKTPDRPLDLYWDYDAYKSHIAISGGGNYVNLIQNMYGSSPTAIGAGLQASLTSGNYPVYAINAIRKGSSTISVPVLYFDVRVDAGMPSGQLVTRFAKSFHGAADSNYLVDIYEDGRLETLGGLKNRGVFQDGFAGEGWQITSEGEGTLKSLTIREELNVYSLMVKKIEFRGGSDVISDGDKVYAAVRDTSERYYLYFDNNDGNLGPVFAVNDIVRCQFFTGDSVKAWKGVVENVQSSVDYYGVDCSRIYVYSTDFTSVDAAKNDIVVRWGNTSDADRQSIIYLTSADNNSPYISFRTNIDSVGDDGDLITLIGNLESVNDPDFGGPLTGNGFYGGNVYVKGKIIVTGGNAATQDYADDAAGTAETNAINQAETLANQAEADAIAAAASDATTKANNAQSTAISTAATDATNKANQAEADANTYADSIVNTLSASLGDLAYDDLVEDAKLGTSILEGGFFKTSLIDATWIQTSVINTTYIEGLALNFTQGKIGDFQIMQNSIGHEIDGTKFVTLANQTDSNVIVNTYDSGGRLGLNIYRYNAAIGTDGLKLSRFGQITDLDTHNIWGATPQFGVQIQYRKDSVNKDIFRVDNAGAMIAGASFTYEKIYTANWSLEADGTATFTKGSIGGFSINSDHLYGGTSGEDRFLLYPQSHLSFLSSDDERTFRIGQDTFPVFAGWEGLGLIENKRIESTYGNVGLYIDAENAGGTGYSQNDRNIAIWVEHGDIKTKEGNMRAYKDWYLKDMDDVNWTLKVGLSLKFLIRQIGSQDPSLYLPNLATINAAIGTPDSGNYQFSVAIKCHRSTNRTVYIHPASGVSMYNWNGGTESTYTMQNGDYFEFVFDGAAWNATVKFT